MASWNESEIEEVKAELAQLRREIRKAEESTPVNVALHERWLRMSREAEAELVALLEVEGVTA